MGMLRLGSLSSQVTKLGVRRERDSQGTGRLISSEETKLEREEIQGKGAIRWLLAGTSSSEICLINTLNWFVVHKGELVGEKPLCRAPFVGVSWSALLGEVLSYSGGTDTEDVS